MKLNADTQTTALNALVGAWAEKFNEQPVDVRVEGTPEFLLVRVPSELASGLARRLVRCIRARNRRSSQPSTGSPKQEVPDAEKN